MSPARRRRLGTVAVSVIGHAAAIVLIARAQPHPPEARDPEPMVVQLVPPLPPPPVPEPPPPEPKPDPAPKPKAKAPVKAAEPKPKLKVRAARVPPPPTVPPLRAEAGPATDASAVSDAELAGAATTGGGGGGAGSGTGASCDMTRRLQAALRKDRLVHAAMAEAGRPRAVRIWNGGWVRHGVQEGAGMAAVREAILWEVGFAPEACRKERVRGLVALSLGEGPGATRIVLGQADWKWGDLLSARAPRTGG